jgi:hypothetical protein
MNSSDNNSNNAGGSVGGGGSVGSAGIAGGGPLVRNRIIYYPPLPVVEDVDANNSGAEDTFETHTPNISAIINAPRPKGFVTLCSRRNIRKFSAPPLGSKDMKGAVGG